MMKSQIRKWLVLGGILVLCLGLGGCYIPPDELAGEAANMGVGTGGVIGMPPVSSAPSKAPTQKPTETPTLAANLGGLNNQGGTGATNVNTPRIDLQGSNNPGAAVTTPGFTNQPTQGPTETPQSLQLGMSGDAIRALQQRLKDLGYLQGHVDGDFGELTRQAVMAFQATNGLEADGKAGKYTMALLNSSSAKRPTPTPKPTATLKPTPKPTATPNLESARYLTIGSSGKDVRQLQNRLIYLGWLVGEADGEYGGATQAAVKAFQAATNGLWDDGIAGPDTQKAIYATNARTTSSAHGYVGAKLEQGAKSEGVRLMQRRLKELGYLTGSADGSFGAATKAAVIAFQTYNGLKADGVAGAGTLGKLFSNDAVRASAGAVNNNNSNNNNNSGSNSGSVSSTGYTTLEEGSEGDAVRKLQRALKELGYYTGSVDGSFGAGTARAVESFQRMNDLKVDGKAGPQTQRVLYGTNSTASSGYATLRPGDEGNDVTNLQYTLYELGYYDGRINGVYNDLTKDAVRAFQISNDVEPVDGIAGNVTLTKLYSSSAVSATAPSKKFATLRPGDSSDQVVQMQDVLVQLGYLGEVTAVYDDATYWAVKSFQERNGLASDGTAGNETLTKLYSDSAIKAY